MNQTEGIIILIAAILFIAIIGLFASGIIKSTDNEEVKKQVQENSDTAIWLIVFIVGLSGAIGTFSLLAYFKR